jgi:hypothetical protein
LFLELSNLHAAAGILQDESFANDMMDAMITHLVKRSDEMLLDDFLVKFLQANAKGSAGRKLIADWMAWSNVVPDAKFGVLLQKVQDADLGYALPKAVLRKTGKEWERDFVPPYVMSTCFYHTHSEAVGLSCSVKREVEAYALA